MDMNLSKLSEIVENRGAWHSSIHEITTSQTQTQDIIETPKFI